MSTLLDHIGWTLLHSLWQGTAAWVLLALAHRALQRHSAPARYLAGCVALAIAVLAPAVTFFRLDLRERLSIERAAIHATTPAAALAPDAPVASHRGETGAVSPAIARASTVGKPLWLEPVAAGVRRWFATVWALGALVGAARLVRDWRASRRWTRESVAMPSAGLGEIFDRIAARCGLKGRVCLRLSDLADVPAVVGWLKPVVLLPACLVTHLSTLQLEALLAHELAHVRRGDFAVNLLQVAAETIFYFHPAIHAINRFIRRERENACDDVAVQVTGDALGYAEALATLETMRTPALALAATGDGDLVSRVRRLLRGDSPASRDLPLGWPLFATVVIAMLIVVVAPLVTAKIMTAEERLAAIRQAVPLTWAERLPRSIRETTDATADPRERNNRGPLMYVDGELRDENGRLPPVDGQLMVMISREHWASSGSLAVHAGRFSGELPAGALTIISWIDGYAPIVAGPFFCAPGTNRISSVNVAVTHGAAAKLRCVDDDQKPLAGVKITGMFVRKNVSIPDASPVVSFSTDATGETTLGHVDAATELRLAAVAPGWESEDHVFAGIPADGVFTWVLHRAKPTPVSLREAGTGKPIAGARVILAADDGGTGGNMRMASPPGKWEVLLGTTDAAGHTVLNTLNAKWHYVLWVVASGFPTTCIQGVTAGQPVNATMSHGGTLRGTLKGVPPGTKIRLTYTVPLAPWRLLDAEMTSGAIAGAETDSSFTFDQVPFGPATLQVNGRSIPVTVTAEASMALIDASATDLRAQAKPMDLVFAPPPGQPPPSGTIVVRLPISSYRMDKSGIVLEDRVMVIENGRVHLPDVAPGPLGVRCEGMIGYWFPAVDKELKTVPPEMRIDVQPAGAIHGRILSAAGSLVVEGAFATVLDMGDRRDPRSAVFTMPSSSREGAVNPGEFTVTPVPFGRTCRVVVSHGTSYAVSSEVRLDAADPLATVDVHLRKGELVMARVVDEDGKPISFTKVGWSYRPVDGYSTGCTLTTDSGGNVTIPEVDFSVPGAYELACNGPGYGGGVTLRKPPFGPLELRVKRFKTVKATAR